MKRILKVSLVLLATVLVFGSCSKYEENSGISLKSKNGRITGDWKLTDFNRTSQWNYNNTITMSSTTYNGVIMTYTSGSNTNTYSYSLKMTINDDGTYKKVETEGGETVEIVDIWTWLDGASEKEQLFLNDDGTYIIKKLTNKELILEMVYSEAEYEGSDNSKYETKITMTFTKQ